MASSSSTTTASASAPSAAQKQWVFLIQNTEGKLLTPGGQSESVLLPHPKTGKPARFLLTNQGKQLLEVQKIDDKSPRSWFIDETVQQDGSLYIASEMDPIFFALHFMQQAKPNNEDDDEDSSHRSKKHSGEHKQMFVPVDQILSHPDFPAVDKLTRCAGLCDLPLICDVKDNASLGKFYQLNKEKVMQWLKRKTNRIVEALRLANEHVGAGSSSSTFVRANVTQSDSDRVCYAVGLLSEYISDELAQELGAALGVTQQLEAERIQQSKKRAHDADGGSGELEDYTRFNTDKGPDTKKVKQTAAQKALEKVDKKGMKSIGSFFSKPATAKPAAAPAKPTSPKKPTATSPKKNAVASPKKSIPQSPKRKATDAVEDGAELRRSPRKKLDSK